MAGEIDRSYRDIFNQNILESVEWEDLIKMTWWFPRAVQIWCGIFKFGTGYLHCSAIVKQ